MSCHFEILRLRSRMTTKWQSRLHINYNLYVCLLMAPLENAGEMSQSDRGDFSMKKTESVKTFGFIYILH